MKAHLNGTVIAEADEAALIKIEGYWYFPPLYRTAIERVGRDFSGYVAFWKDVEVAA